MTQCPWDPIQAFSTPGEFSRFVAWMGNLVSQSSAKEVPVVKPYAGATTFTEKWYMHVASGQIWRLVWPDAPFKGLFERVH
jgi:hypothetical protein